MARTEHDATFMFQLRVEYIALHYSSVAPLQYLHSGTTSILYYQQRESRAAYARRLYDLDIDASYAKGLCQHMNAS